jgi:hypothetical protein
MSSAVAGQSFICQLHPNGPYPHKTLLVLFEIPILKYQTMIVELTIYPFISANVYFLCFGTLVIFCACVYQCSIFLLNSPLGQYLCAFFVSCNSC